MQNKIYRTKSRDSEGPCERIVNGWKEFDRLVIGADIILLANGARDLKFVLRPKADTLNTPCSLILINDI